MKLSLNYVNIIGIMLELMFCSTSELASHPPAAQLNSASSLRVSRIKRTRYFNTEISTNVSFSLK